MKNKRLLAISGLLILFLGLPIFLAWNFLIAPVMEATGQFRSLVGKPESEVIATLGQPQFRVSPAEAKAKGIDYPWREKNYQPVPERPVHKLVLLYEPNRGDKRKTPFAIYVFIDDEDKVEAIDFAGT
ncbi:MAG TPA: hypothetical protein VHE55_07870 [Fimbriimonadaceae bacterium]|nr:hypothetical protein [Fimbriimonadaceae bacterium]